MYKLFQYNIIVVKKLISILVVVALIMPAAFMMSTADSYADTITAKKGDSLFFGKTLQNVVTDEKEFAYLETVDMERGEMKVINGIKYGKGYYWNGNKYNNEYIREDPIEWIVLDNSNGYYTLLSKKVLGVRKFSDAEVATDETGWWHKSPLREWLNTNFYNDAFTSEEQKDMATQTYSSWYHPYEDAYIKKIDGHYVTVSDKVTLPDENDLEKIDKSDWEAQITQYEAILEFDNTDEVYVKWWLRGPAVWNYGNLQQKYVDEEIDAWYGTYSYGVRPMIKVKTDSKYLSNSSDSDESDDDTSTLKTSTGFRIYPTKEKYLGQKPYTKTTSKQYNKYYRGIRYMLSENMVEDKSCAIPGLSMTVGKYSGGEIKSNKYVPQGLCKFGNYYIISAYHGVDYESPKRQKSVLYVLDSSWKLVTVIAQPTKYHNGGIAYDPDGDVLWFTGNTEKSYKGESFVNCVAGSVIRSKINSGDISTYLTDVEVSPNIYINNNNNKPSCLDYHGGRLWVGTCREGSSNIIGYRTSRDSLDTSDNVNISNLDSKLNGFTFDDKKANNLWLSYSTGRSVGKKSYITYSEIPTDLKPGTCVDIRQFTSKTVTVPRMNEEVMSDGNLLYVLYESAATPYLDAYIRTDRITAVQKSVWTDESAANKQPLLMTGSSEDVDSEIECDETLSYSYNNSGDGQIVGFTPKSNGSYTLKISDITSNDEVYVTAEITDSEGGEYGSISTAEYNYDSEDGEFILNEDAEGTFNLTGGKDYMILLCISHVSEAEKEEDVEGTYEFGISSDGSVKTVKAEVGRTVSETVAEGGMSCFSFAPPETGIYNINWSTDGELSSKKVLAEDMKTEIDFNDNFCILDAGKTYYFISGLSEGTLASNRCTVEFEIEAAESEELEGYGSILVSGGSIINYVPQQNGRQRIKADSTGEFAIEIYDDNNSHIAAGSKDISFEVEKDKTYRIVVSGEDSVEITVCGYNKNINKSSITCTANSTYTYTGKPITPSVKIKELEYTLIKDRDYTVEYQNNINAGTAKVVVTGKGDYTGKAEKTFTIGKAKITGMTLSASAYTYNKKMQTPGVTVVSGSKRIASETNKGTSDFALNYSSGRKNIGSYSVKVTGKGNYTGTVSKTFKINPKGATIKTPKKAKKAFTAKWSKQSSKMSKSRITGYQVRYSLKKNFSSGVKTKTVKGYKKTSVKISKLKSKKTYYVQVRTYMEVDGKNYYSPWSKTKSVKTK